MLGGGLTPSVPSCVPLPVNTKQLLTWKVKPQVKQMLINVVTVLLQMKCL